MTTWNIGRRYTSAACRYCGKVCASSQGRLAHERRCPKAATLLPVEEVAQQRQSYAVQAARSARPRPHLPGGPPLGVEAERVYALWQAARARGDEYEQALYVRQYLVARARDWGVVRPAKRRVA